MLASILAARDNLLAPSDHKQYRRLQSRRAARLRKTLGLQHSRISDKSNMESVSFQPENWEIAVKLSERAWAAAQEARALSTKTGKSQVRSRLSRAHKLATQVYDLAVETSSDPSLKLESAVYRDLIKAEFALVTRRWDDVARAFSCVRVGLTALNSVSKSGVYAVALSQLVDPSLRIAFTHTGEDRSVDITRLARKIAQGSDVEALVVEVAVTESKTSEGASIPQAPGVHAIKWRTYTVAVDDGDLREAIGVAHASHPHLDASSSSEENFDNALSAWQHATDILQDLLRQKKEDLEDESIYIIRTYLCFHMISLRMRRDLVLLSSCIKPGDEVRVLDQLLQSASELQGLPGVAGDVQLSLALDAMAAALRARRMRSLSHHYQISSPQKALALLARADSVLREAPEIQADKWPAELAVKFNIAQQWQRELYHNLARMHGLAVLARRKDNFSFAADDMSQCGATLVRAANLKGHVRPLPVKPVFYDVAYDYIEEQPEDEHSAEIREAEEVADAVGPKDSAKTRSLFGLFR